MAKPAPKIKKYRKGRKDKFSVKPVRAKRGTNITSKLKKLGKFK